METQEEIRRWEEVIERARRKVGRVEPGWEEEGSTWGRMEGLVGPVRWDWRGWLPQGFLVILASEPGLGKSLLCLRVAACYLAGMDWPDGQGFEGERGLVLWCEGEGGQALNVERARAWGLDLEGVVTPLANPLLNFKIDNEQHAARLLAQARRPEVKLVVVDSLRGVHSQQGAGLAATVGNLADMARVIGKPILLTHHLRKRSGADRGGGVSLERLRGSAVITQPARVVWALDRPDAADGMNRRLAVIKSNLGVFPEPIGMRMSGLGVSFGMAPERRVVGELERAVEMMGEMLADGGRPYGAVMAECGRRGITEATLRRAKKVLGVRSVRVKGEVGWWWEMGGRRKEG